MLDTVDAIFHYTVTNPHVCLAIDRGPNEDTGEQKLIAARVRAKYPQVGVFKSGKQWGWGAGLYGLLVDSYLWARERYAFDHLVSLDYDALFVGAAPDARLLDDCRRDGAGLVGVVTSMGKAWRRQFEAHWPDVMKLTGDREPEEGWEKHAVYGAVMALTKDCLRVMEEAGYLRDPVRNYKDVVKIADDPMLTFLVKSLGFGVVNNRGYCYNVWKRPERPEAVLARDPNIVIFHPAKLGPGGGPILEERERMCRNRLRQRRGRKPLKDWR